MPKYLFVAIQTEEYVDGFPESRHIPITGGNAKSMYIFGNKDII